jgi:hypothetical protein
MEILVGELGDGFFLLKGVLPFLPGFLVCFACREIPKFSFTESVSGLTGYEQCISSSISGWPGYPLAYRRRT